MCNNYSQIPWCQPSSLSLQSFDPWSFKTIAIILLRCSLSELEPRETRSTDCTKPGKNSVNIYIHITTLAPKKKKSHPKNLLIFSFVIKEKTFCPTLNAALLAPLNSVREHFRTLL